MWKFIEKNRAQLCCFPFVLILSPPSAPQSAARRLIRCTYMNLLYCFWLVDRRKHKYGVWLTTDENPSTFIALPPCFFFLLSFFLSQAYLFIFNIQLVRIGCNISVSPISCNLLLMLILQLNPIIKQNVVNEIIDWIGLCYDGTELCRLAVVA